MLNTKLAYNSFFLAAIFVLIILISSNVCAFTDRYEEDLKEGEEVIASLEVLDTLEFTYYNKNYSIRVLGIYTSSSTLRIEKTGFDIDLGETKSFNIDDAADYDVNITLLSLESDNAKIKIGLNKKPEPEEEQNQTNNTNSANSKTDNQNSTNLLLNRYLNRTRTIKRSTKPTDQSSSNTNSNDDDDDKDTTREQKNSISGAGTINVTINITLTPKSAGLLLTTSILLSGLFVYHKVSEISDKKKTKAWRVFNRLRRRIRLKSKEILKKIRVKLGELIAGKEFEKNDKTRK